MTNRSVSLVILVFWSALALRGHGGHELAV